YDCLFTGHEAVFGLRPIFVGFAFPPPFAGCCFRVDCLSFLNPQLHVLHVSSHASYVVGYVSRFMCFSLVAASRISCSACLSARWLRKCNHDLSVPVIHNCV